MRVIVRLRSGELLEHRPRVEFGQHLRRNRLHLGRDLPLLALAEAGLGDFRPGAGDDQGVEADGRSVLLARAGEDTDLLSPRRRLALHFLEELAVDAELADDREEELVVMQRT